MSGMVAWLEAELARIEEIARAATHGPWLVDPDEYGGLAVRDADPEIPGLPGHCTVVFEPHLDEEAGRNFAHIAANHPEAVLRRVAADRQILAEHAKDYGNCRVCAGPEWASDDAEGNRDWSRPAIPWPCRTVLLLAGAYGWAEGAA